MPDKAKEVSACKAANTNHASSYGEDVHGKTNIAVIYIMHSYVP